MWITPLAFSGYLFGGALTGRLLARGEDLHQGDVLLGVAACVLLWPLAAAWLGGEKALQWFFGTPP